MTKLMKENRAMLEKIWANYDFKHPEAEFIRHNENMTYRVKDDAGQYLLRIHKAADGLNLSQGCGNLSRQALIEREIELLCSLHSAAYITTRYPIRNSSGEYLTDLGDGVWATVLSWLEGEDLKDTPVTEGLAYGIGQAIGKMHIALSQIPCPDRYCYDGAFVDQIAADIHSAYELKHISEDNYRVMGEALSRIRQMLERERQKYIYAHGDLRSVN